MDMEMAMVTVMVMVMVMQAEAETTPHRVVRLNSSHGSLDLADWRFRVEAEADAWPDRGESLILGSRRDPYPKTHGSGAGGPLKCTHPRACATKKFTWYVAVQSSMLWLDLYHITLRHRTAVRVICSG